jgi:glycosyltransferase involved in cell wall biosynthesis
MPTYNRAHLLPRALDSLFAQNYPNIEPIVIDDGSTDNTREVLKPYLDRIVFLESDHGGTASARNVGMKASTGKYIAFLDSDDTYLPEKLALQVAFAEQHPEVGMVCSEFSGGYTDGQVQEQLMRTYHPIWEERNLSFNDVFEQSGVFECDGCSRPVDYYIGDIFKLVIQDTVIPTNTMLVTREAYETVGYQDTNLRFAQEYDFCVRICKHFKIAFLDVPTYAMYFHDQQATSSLMFESEKTPEQLQLEVIGWDCFLVIAENWGLKDESFYRENRRIVNRRLSDLHYERAKILLRMDEQRRAREDFAASIRYSPTRFKAMILWFAAALPRIGSKAVVGLMDRVFRGL